LFVIRALRVTHLPDRASKGAMSEKLGTIEKLNKVQPEVNVLAASTIVGTFAVGLPMAAAIIWVCS
jgi:hypothetical protein